MSFKYIGSTVVGKEVKIRDYSEPLENSKLSAYTSHFSSPAVDFDVDFDIHNIHNYEYEHIKLWRAMTKNPYIQFAVDDIVNEIVTTFDANNTPIKLDLSNIKLSTATVDKIHDEFVYILKLLNFNKKAQSYVRDWYVDGKAYFYIEVEKNEGLTRITQLNPIRLQFINDENVEEHYVYKDDTGYASSFEIPKNNIIPIYSGLMDDTHKIYISYLDNAFIPLNQLNSIEDALLVYRMARAPARRVFYIDTGQLSKSKAEAYMQEVARNFKNNIDYDPNTGKFNEGSLHLSLLDDIFLPRSAEGTNTEVSQLEGSSAFTENLDDLDYFRKKLFRALHIPFQRWTEMSEVSNAYGRAAEISRDELKYAKYVNQLRMYFNEFFISLLKNQLLAKNILTDQDFANEQDNFTFIWASDSAYKELSKIDILKERLEVMDSLVDYSDGNKEGYFSREWLIHNVLKLTDKEVEEIEADKKREMITQEDSEGNDEGGFGGDDEDDGNPFAGDGGIEDEEESVDTSNVKPDVTNTIRLKSNKVITVNKNVKKDSTKTKSKTSSKKTTKKVETKSTTSSDKNKSIDKQSYYDDMIEYIKLNHDKNNIDDIDLITPAEDNEKFTPYVNKPETEKLPAEVKQPKSEKVNDYETLSDTSIKQKEVVNPDKKQADYTPNRVVNSKNIEHNFNDDKNIKPAKDNDDYQQYMVKPDVEKIPQENSTITNSFYDNFLDYVNKSTVEPNENYPINQATHETDDTDEINNFLNTVKSKKYKKL